MPLFKNQEKAENKKDADKATVNAALKVSTTTTTTTNMTAETPEMVFGKQYQANTKTDDCLDKLGAYEQG
jgi:hypothetical protein